MTTVSEILKRFGDDSVNIIRSNMRRAGQNATGETSASLASDVIQNGERLQVSGARHIYVLEKGRSPYKGGAEANLKGKLATWMRAKGVETRGKQTIEQAAQGLAIAINKKGTKLWREGGRTDIITPIFAQDRFDKLNKDIAEVQFKKVVQAVENGSSNR